MAIAIGMSTITRVLNCRDSQSMAFSVPPSDPVSMSLADQIATLMDRPPPSESEMH